MHKVICSESLMLLSPGYCVKSSRALLFEFTQLQLHLYMHTKPLPSWVWLFSALGRRKISLQMSSIIYLTKNLLVKPKKIQCRKFINFVQAKLRNEIARKGWKGSTCTPKKVEVKIPASVAERTNPNMVKTGRCFPDFFVINISIWEKFCAVSTVPAFPISLFSRCYHGGIIRKSYFALAANFFMCFFFLWPCQQFHPGILNFFDFCILGQMALWVVVCYGLPDPVTQRMGGGNSSKRLHWLLHGQTSFWVPKEWWTCHRELGSLFPHWKVHVLKA